MHVVTFVDDSHYYISLLTTSVITLLSNGITTSF
jgi:hypothetical protein